MTVYVEDGFLRTLGAGWGTAGIGGVYTESKPAGVNTSVNGASGVVGFTGVVGGYPTERLAVSALDVSGAARFATNNLVTETRFRVLMRASGTITAVSGYYAEVVLAPALPVVIVIGRTVPGTDTVLRTLTTDLISTVARLYQVEFEAVVNAIGPNTLLRARVWDTTAGTPPVQDGWVAEQAESTGPQVAGVFQLWVTRVVPGVSAGQNVTLDVVYLSDPPRPVFAWTASGLSVTFSSTGTTGDIVANDWDFGDHTTHATGTAPVHAYAGPGSYAVTYSVTTKWGATYTFTDWVTVGQVEPVFGAPPGTIPVIRIDGVNVCDLVYSASWSSGVSHWGQTFNGATCSLRLRGEVAVVQGDKVTIATPGGRVLWVGTVDQVTRQLEPFSLSSDTLVTAMDIASFLGRWHMPRGTTLPSQKLPNRLVNLKPIPSIRYVAKWPAVPASRWPDLAQKTHTADKLRSRTHLDMIREALQASIAFAYVGRNGDIMFAPWEAPAGTPSGALVNLDDGIDCAVRATVEADSTEGIINRWTVGNAEPVDIVYRSSIEAYGEHAYDVAEGILSHEADFEPIAQQMRLDQPADAPTVELRITDWDQDAVILEPLDIARFDGTRWAVMGVQHDLSITEWRVTINLDRDPWSVNGRPIPSLLRDRPEAKPAPEPEPKVETAA